MIEDNIQHYKESKNITESEKIKYGIFLWMVRDTYGVWTTKTKIKVTKVVWEFLQKGWV